MRRKGSRSHGSNGRSRFKRGGDGGSSNRRRKNGYACTMTKLSSSCALIYDLAWRAGGEKTIEMEEERPNISVTMTPKGAYVTKVHGPKSMFRVCDIIISTYPPVPPRGNIIISRARDKRYVSRVYDDLSNFKSMTKLKKYICSHDRIPYKISDAIDRLFFEFCDPVTMRIDPWQTSAMLSSSLYASYTPDTWPVERWFRDANDGTLTRAQLKRACEVCCAIAPGSFAPLLEAMCVNVVSTHLLVACKSRRLILHRLRNKLINLAIGVLIMQNRRQAREDQHYHVSKKKHFEKNLSKSQSRLLSKTFMKKKHPTALQLRCQYLCAEIMSRSNLVRRILARSLKNPIRMVVFTVGVETFRSATDFYHTAIEPLESFLGGLRLRTLVDTRAHSLSRGMRHRSFQTLCELKNVQYVRMGKAENIGLLRSYLSPILVIGNHADIEESSERAHLSSRLSSNKIARVVHLVSREDKILFSAEHFPGTQCIELGTKHAARAMLNAASDSDGNFFHFGWGKTVFSPFMSERLRRTSHERR